MCRTIDCFERKQTARHAARTACHKPSQPKVSARMAAQQAKGHCTHASSSDGISRPDQSSTGSLAMVDLTSNLSRLSATHACRPSTHSQAPTHLYTYTVALHYRAKGSWPQPSAGHVGTAPARNPRRLLATGGQRGDSSNSRAIEVLKLKQHVPASRPTRPGAWARRRSGSRNVDPRTSPLDTSGLLGV